MTLSPYDQLRRQMIISGTNPAHTNLLPTLKNLFKSEINSPRRLDNIKTLGELLTVLEVRAVLSEDNVAPLKEIAQRFANGPDLLRAITDYETSHVPRDHIIYHGAQNNQFHAAPQNQNIPNIAANTLANNITRKKQRIYNTIVDDIGKFWKDFGRKLNVKECKIEDIDNTYNTIAQKAEQVIHIFDERADTQRWFFALCDALEKARRWDLSRTIKEIMMMNM